MGGLFLVVTFSHILQRLVYYYYYPIMCLEFRFNYVRFTYV